MMTLRTFIFHPVATHVLRAFYFILFFAGHLNGAIVNVGPPPASIQTAINAANPGDTVQLSNGTYIQSVLITKSITLNGNGAGISIIQCPNAILTNTYTFTPTGDTFHPFVMVQGTSNVIIQNLTVDGASNPLNGGNFRFVGIGYHNAGGIIQNVIAVRIRNSGLSAQQNGTAIAGAVDDGNPYTILVQNCAINTFQKNGIDMRGTTLSAQILSNTITGITPSSPATANGIVIRNGAVAEISTNTITNMVTPNPFTSSAAILTISNGLNQNFHNNILNNNNDGIVALGAGDGLSIVQNSLQNNSDIGILVQDTSGTTTLTANTVANSGNQNMYLFDTLGNQPFHLSLNQISGGPVGLLVQGSGLSGPVVTMNSDSFVGNTQYYIQEITAPNDIWPSTATVSFDGLVSGNMTFAQFKTVQTKILDKLSPVLNPLLGLVLDFIPPTPLPPTSFVGKVKENEFLTQTSYLLKAKWKASASDFPVYYRIYKKNQLVAVISNGSPLVFETSVKSERSAQTFSISAVNVNNVESVRVPIKIISH